MRLFITAIIVWAVLLGFVITGMKVMATSPEVKTVTTVSVMENDSRHPADIDRTDSNEAIRPVER